MVDVEQRALRALEQDARGRRACSSSSTQPDGARRTAAASARSRSAARSSASPSISGDAEAAAQRVVVGSSSSSILAGSASGSARSQTRIARRADLVLVGRADAAAGGADLAVPSLARAPRAAGRARGAAAGSASRSRRSRRLSGAIADALRRAARRSPRRSAQGSTTTPLPITRQLARPHDAGGQQRQLVGGAVDDQRVAGIVAALEAHDDVGALATASRRSCPCPRRPTGRRRPRRSPRS